MEATKDTTTGEGLYQELSYLPWNNLISVTSEESRNLTSNKSMRVTLIFIYTTHRKA